MFVALARPLSFTLLFEDSSLPVQRAALGVPDVLARVAPQILVEPVQGLVVVVIAQAIEGKTPQSLGRHVALGVAIRQIAEQLFRVYDELLAV